MAEFESLFLSTWDDFPWNWPLDVPFKTECYYNMLYLRDIPVSLTTR